MKVLIIGNGIAAVTSAQSLSKDPDIDLTILSKEPNYYYARPRLWSYIAGEITRDELFVRDEDWYRENRIKVMLGETAVKILPESKRVETLDGKFYEYNRLLLAMGAEPFIPPIPGHSLDGVFVLRTLEDADAIHTHAEESSRAVVIGGGLLGLEIARVLAGLGLDVTVLEVAPYLLPRQLDREGAGLLKVLLQEMGLKIRTNAQVKQIDGENSVSSILLEDGERLFTDLVLLSTGIRSNTNLATAAGLTVNRGIVVDHNLQTSDKDIYAAGDAAEFDGRVYGIIPAALEQARAAAAAITGSSPEYEGTIPSTNLKVTGISVSSIGQYSGDCEGCDMFKAVDLENKQYRKIVVENGIIKGAILVNDQERANGISRLVRTGKDINEYADQILKDGFDLKRLTHRKIVR